MIERAQHIYYCKRVCYNEIKLLCQPEKYTDAEYRKGNFSNHYWTIDGVRQWSIGAGHNATCPKCLIKYAKRKISKDNMVMEKLIKLAEKAIEGA